MVDCVANVPVGASVGAKATLEKALGGAGKSPCLTILETTGENPNDYPGYMYNSSISCFAAVKAKGEAPISRHDYKSNDTDIRVVDQGNGMVWVSVEAAGDGVAATSVFWAKIRSALAQTTKSCGLSDIVDCSVFVPPSTKDAVLTAVQHAVANSTSSNGKYAAAQLTAVKRT